MAFIDWSDSLSTQYSGIDEQHKVLINLINQLFDAMKQQKGKEINGKILEGLIDYTKTHFSYEEQMMDKFGYPDMIAHKKAHKALVEQVEDLYKRFHSGQITISIEIMSFLKDWLNNHILSVDKLFGGFLIQKSTI